jgi:hypothetical protein
MKAYMGDCLDQQGCDLLLRMLKYNPDERISVRHPSAPPIVILIVYLLLKKLKLGQKPRYNS